MKDGQIDNNIIIAITTIITFSISAVIRLIEKRIDANEQKIKENKNEIDKK